MAAITTARILADKALQRTCGQECVDWATEMLVRGHDGRHLAELAGMVPPHNHFEMAELRNRALSELGVQPIAPYWSVAAYACELLQHVRDARPDWHSALSEVRLLCQAEDYRRDLYDFYLLDLACRGLREHGVQEYWPGATRRTVEGIVRQRADAYVREVSAADWYRALMAIERGGPT